MFTLPLSRRGLIVSAVAAAALVLVILGTAWALSTGDDQTSRADVVTRIESDPGMAGSPGVVVDCVADWYMTSATPEQREAFVAGDTSAPAAGTQADPALVECLKQAAEPPA